MGRPHLALGLMAIALAVFQPSPAACQTSWHEAEGAITVTFPGGWEEADAAQMRLYSGGRDQPTARNLFHRVAGGLLRKRYLTGYVRLLTEQRPADVSVDSVARLMQDRIKQSGLVVLPVQSSRAEFPIVAYRYRHTGAPVTQAVILFSDRRGRVYSIEITGHQKDEELLLGEARQISHSVDVR